MKKLLLVAALAIPVNVSAGIPVADIPAFAQRLSEFTLNVERWRSQLRDLAATASTVSNTYQALTSVTDLHDVIRNPYLNRYLPDDYLSIYNDAVTLGLGGLFGGPLDLYNAGLVRDLCRAIKSAASKANCEARQTRGYHYQHAAKLSYQNVVERSAVIDRLTAKLGSMNDPKEVMDLQALIQTEIASIQNESVRMDSLRMAHEASEEVIEQQRDQLANEIWDQKKGIPLEPVGFGAG